MSELISYTFLTTCNMPVCIHHKIFIYFTSRQPRKYLRNTGKLVVKCFEALFLVQAYFVVVIIVKFVVLPNIKKQIQHECWDTKVYRQISSKSAKLPCALKEFSSLHSLYTSHHHHHKLKYKLNFYTITYALVMNGIFFLAQKKCSW